MSEVEQGGGGAFAKYRPIAELGAGGMAEVFLALSQGPAGFNKLVVIKQIREQFADDPEFLTMFLDEARLAARLNHPNVVQTNEVGGDGKRYYICMEYLEGQPLNRVLNRIGEKGGITLGMQLRILVDALAGLHHAHELCDFDGKPLQVVHRDATPHNIFLTYAGQVKVVDFGIAKALSSSSETRTGVLKGKVAYMAPEQAMGEKVDRRADVFSMGMILWEMLAGKRMFKGIPDVAILQRIVNATIPSPRTANPELPGILEGICMKALAHDREHRYATAAEMAAELEQAVDELKLKGSVRDAGKIVDKFFASEREKIKQLVEAQAAEGVAQTFTTGGRPKLPVFDAPTVESMSGPQGTGSGSGSIRRGSAPTSMPSLTGSGRVQGDASQPSSSLTNMAATTVEPRPQSNKMLLLAAGGAALFGAVAAVAFFATRTPAGSAPGAPTTTAVAPALAAPAPTLSIESTPPGATVSEGGSVIGKTPLAVPLDPAAKEARKIVVSLDGYVPYAIDQAPSKESVRIVVPLAPVASPQATATPSATATAEAVAKAKSTTPRPPAPAPAPAPTAKPPPTLEINMAR